MRERQWQWSWENRPSFLKPFHWVSPYLFQRPPETAWTSLKAFQKRLQCRARLATVSRLIFKVWDWQIMSLEDGAIASSWQILCCGSTNQVQEKISLFPKATQLILFCVSLIPCESTQISLRVFQEVLQYRPMLSVASWLFLHIYGRSLEEWDHRL